MKQLLLLFILSYSYLNANESKQNTQKSSPTILFSIDKKEYSTEIFPKEFEEFPKKTRFLFISKYLFYTLLLDELKNEQLTYASEIQKNINLEREENKRIGKLLSPLEKMFFNKKIITDTIAYNILLKEDSKIDYKIKEFYIQHKKDFFYPKRVELSLIVVKTKALALKIIKELKENNNIKNFSKLAKKHSILKSKLHGGYIGLIGEKGLSEVNFNILYNSKSNSLVEKILNNKEYYTIAYLLNKYPAEQKKLDQVSNEIKKHLLKNKIDLWKRNKFEIKKKETNVKLYKVK